MLSLSLYKRESFLPIVGDQVMEEHSHLQLGKIGTST
jgi:hypothetical protein